MLGVPVIYWCITNHAKISWLETTIILLSLVVSIGICKGLGWGYLMRLQLDSARHSRGLTRYLSLHVVSGLVHVASAKAGLSFLTSYSSLGLPHKYPSKQGRSGFTFSDLALKVIGHK